MGAPCTERARRGNGGRDEERNSPRKALLVLNALLLHPAVLAAARVVFIGPATQQTWRHQVSHATPESACQLLLLVFPGRRVVLSLNAKTVTDTHYNSHTIQYPYC